MSTNNWIDEIEEPRAEGAGNQKNTKQPRKKGPGKDTYMAWAGVGAGLVLILILLFLFRGCGSSPSADGQELANRVSLLEDRLINLESELFKQKEMSKRLNRSEDFQVLTHRLDTLSRKLQALEKKTQEIARQTGAGQKESKPAVNEEDTAFLRDQTYTVRPGDTLYSIGVKHKVSVENLRQWNDLGSNGVIYPGQKLQVAPKSEP